jgi:isoamyl acetate esterase
MELEGMVALLHDPASPCYSPDTRIVLIGPPPIQRDRSQREIWDKLFDPPKKIERDNDRLEKYAAACKAVAIKAGVPFVDPFYLFRKAAGSLEEAILEPFFTDGVHLAEPGYKVGFLCLTYTFN